MPDEQAIDAQTIKENTKLIEWISTIYTIFWALWLGFFVDDYVNTCNLICLTNRTVNNLLKTLSPFLVFPLAFLVLVYSYYLIKWLWGMRLVNPDTSFKLVIPRLRNGSVIWIFTTASVITMAYFCTINWFLTFWGILATLGWIGLVCFVILSEKKGWDINE